MEGRPVRLSSIVLARALSIAGHPFVLSPLTIGATTRSWRWAALVAAGTTLPLLAIIARKVRRGSWSDFDVSRHDQRHGLYAAAIPLVVITALVFWFLGAHRDLLRGFAAATVMLGLGAAANRFLKTSMHMMCAAFCAVIMIRVYPLSAIGVIPFVAAVAWSRRKLERHTLVEVLVGLGIGLAAGLVVVVG